MTACSALTRTSRSCGEWLESALYDRQTMPTALPMNWLFATLLLQHRFHFF